MPQVALNQPAPDFTLKSVSGEPVTLSSFRGKKNVLLVFNRGFT
jgi:peroxiredoxin (alkyl hydroperoxide reductase subunit C)